MFGLSARVSRRRIRRSILLVPCLAFTWYITFYYKGFGFDSVRPSRTKIVTHTIIPICTEGTVAPKAAERKPLESHSFRSDGLLEVNPNGRHPIYDLIKRAEAEWDKKMDRQSKTLGEAVAEYERRYRRAPPKGFDHWFVPILCLQSVYKI
jgi:hypothetical protein